MKNLLLLAAIIYSQATFAQSPVITNSFVSNLTGIVYTQVSTSQPYAPGNSGANQTWNYTSYIFSDNSLNTFVQPDTAYGYSDFTSCTDAERIEVISGGTSTAFRKLNGNIYSLFGWSTQTTNSSFSRYINPLDLYHFPLSMGTSYSDTYYNIDTVIQTSLSLHIAGECNYLVDGYGTLITPLATFTNVLRIKGMQTSSDTVYHYGNATAVNPDTITTYTWIAASHPGIPLMSISIKKQYGNTYYYSDLAWLSNTAVQDMEEQVPVFYPNPAGNTITVDNVLPNTPIVISNLLGETIIKETTVNSRIEINISGLPAGMYFINNKKFLKQ